MNQISNFELNPTVNESGKSILLNCAYQKNTQSPTTKALAQRLCDASKIREITSNITISWIF